MPSVLVELGFLSNEDDEKQLTSDTWRDRMAVSITAAIDNYCIAPKILDTLQAGYFMHAFRDKGRFSALLREIPVKVIIHPAASLLGARRKAQELLSLRG